MFGFGTMHYVLILVALVVGIMILVWRWKRLQKQNRALEEELRVLEPFNNPIPSGHLPDEIPRPEAPPAPPAPQEAAAKAEPEPPQPTTSFGAPKPTADVCNPPLVTPDTVEESDSDDDEATGEAPVLGPVVEAEPEAGPESQVQVLEPVVEPVADPVDEVVNDVVEELVADVATTGELMEAVESPKLTRRSRRKRKDPE